MNSYRSRHPALTDVRNCSHSPIPEPFFEDTFSSGMPGRTRWTLHSAAAKSNSTASARSILVSTARSAVLKMVGKQHHSQILSNIVGRGTHQITHVLYKKEIQPIQVPAFQSIPHHGGFHIAKSSGSDLPYGRLRARQPGSVVVSRQVTNQGRDTVIGPHEGKRFLQKGGLSGAGARHQTHHVDSRFVESLAELARHYIVMPEHVLSDFHQAGTHSCISKATT